MHRTKVRTIPSDIRTRVQARAEQCVALAENHFGRKYDPVIISYTLRGQTAGTYTVGTRAVNFNSVLLMENIDDFIRRTVAHEVAHYINFCNKDDDDGPVPHLRHLLNDGWRLRRPKRDVHGPKWQAIMRLFDAPVSRTHSYDVSNATVRTKRTYRVVCSGCGQEHMVTKNVFNRIRCGVKYTLRGGVHNLHGQLIIPNATATPIKPEIDPNDPWVDFPPEPPRRPAAAQSKSGSKLDQCKELYKKYCGIPRQEMIIEFVRQAQCTPAGAATYYATCKKLYG